MIREKALERGAKIILGHQVVDFQQDETGVVVAIEHYGQIKAQYLVGCDGAASMIRKKASITSSGPGPVQSQLL